MYMLATGQSNFLTPLNWAGASIRNRQFFPRTIPKFSFTLILTNHHAKSAGKIWAKHCLTSSKLANLRPTLPYKGLRQRFEQTRGHFVLSKFCEIMKLRFESSIISWMDSKRVLMGIELGAIELEFAKVVADRREKWT